MATEVKLPPLGDGIDSGDVLDVLVKEGDQIKKEQGIIEIETDKATVEVPSTHEGRVTKVHVKPGDSVPVGGTLITVETEAAGAAEQPAAPAEPAQQPAPPKAEQPAAPPAPAPAQPEPTRPEEPSPELDEQLEEEEDAQEAAPGPSPSRAFARQEQPRPPAGGPEREAGQVRPNQAAAAQGEAVPASPSVRRFAREVGVDLERVRGTGPGNRITREDVLEAVRQANLGSRAAAPGAPAPQQAAPPQAAPPAPAGQAAPKAGGVTPPGQPTSDAWGPVRVEKMSKVRRTIAAKMHESWSTVPRVTNQDDADITDLEEFRQSSKADYAQQGIKLTTMPFLIRAVATALKHHPLLNASLDLESGQIIYKEYVNIGIAVDSERGLVVPSLRNADRLPIPEIARKLSQIADSVRNNNFAIEDLRGSTFTISNLGAIGGTYSTPIVNTPEVAILLVGRSRKLPVVMDGDELAIRLMMPLSLSYDHRLVDGAAAARFLNDVIGYLEAPSRLLLAP